MARGKRMFTVFDAMDQKGYFDSNPANASAQDESGVTLYKGPVEFPRMLYHPEGKRRITVPAEIIVTPLGPKAVGEQSELISQIVQDAEEEAKMLKAGWHKLPADAMRAAQGLAPELSLEARLAKAEAEKAAAEKELNDLRAQALAASQASGATVGRRTQPAASTSAAE